jgi:signal transduction histidine kinase
MGALERCQNIAELKGDDQFQRSVQALQKTNRVTMECSDRISQLIGSLKNFSRLDEAASQRVDLHEGIDSALILLQHELKGRIDVVKEYGDLPRINCQVSEINQVFMNILRNAAGAIEGQGQITIRTSANASQASVRIEDTGVGIAPDLVRRVFDPGFTRKGSRVRAKMGLFTSYQIVQKHEGEIRIESELGKGTAVTVIL